MSTVLASFTLPHVIAGTAALILFWINALAPKGTAAHRRFGHAYLIAMAVVLLTGIPLTVHLIVQGHVITGTFLGYLLLLVAWSCLNSVRSIRCRHDRKRFYDLGHLVAAAILAVAGIIVMVVGIRSGSALILVPFGAIGPLSAFGALRDRGRVEFARNWWLKEHYGATIASGIATHIAFAQIGLARLLPGDAQLAQMLSWLLPLVIGIAAIMVLNRRYRPATATMKPVIEPAGIPNDR